MPIDPAPSDALDLTHRTFAPHIPTMPARNLQALLFDCIEAGPTPLIGPIEAEFQRRGVDAYGKLPTEH